MEVVSRSATAAAVASQFQSQQESPLLRGVFPATRGAFPATRGAFSISKRAHICFPQRRFLFFLVKSGVESPSTVDEQQDFRVVPSNVLMAEKEEAKAVLTMFLEKEIGLDNEAATAMISKSLPFIDHLVARLHSIDKTRVSRRELTTLEITDALIPFLEYLRKEHGDSLVDVIENFPNRPDKECEDHRDSFTDIMENFPNAPEEEREQLLSEASSTNLLLDSMRLKAMAQVAEIGTDGQLPSLTLYLIDIGLDMDQIKEMARKWPPITLPFWGRNLKPIVEFLLDLGVPPLNIANILYKMPQLFGCSLSENIIPSMTYLETVGLDKSKWAKLISRCPTLLTRSRQKVEATVDFLCELGLSGDGIGKVLTRCPEIIGCSIDDKLRPTMEYFRSMGVNIKSLIGRYPVVFVLSLERKLKPTTEFFLDKGYSIDEIGAMVSRYGAIYTFSLTKNLVPKWDFFLTMDYPRSELVKIPTYFGYSLEGRINPRYAQIKECGLKVPFGKFLFSSDSDFPVVLNKIKMKQVLESQLPWQYNIGR